MEQGRGERKIFTKGFELTYDTICLFMECDIFLVALG